MSLSEEGRYLPKAGIYRKPPARSAGIYRKPPARSAGIYRKTPARSAGIYFCNSARKFTDSDGRRRRTSQEEGQQGPSQGTIEHRSNKLQARLSYKGEDGKTKQKFIPGLFDDIPAAVAAQAAAYQVLSSAGPLAVWPNDGGKPARNKRGEVRASRSPGLHRVVCLKSRCAPCRAQSGRRVGPLARSGTVVRRCPRKRRLRATVIANRSRRRPSSRTRWRRRSSSPRCCCHVPSRTSTTPACRLSSQRVPHTRLHDLLITRCGRGQKAGAGGRAEGRGQRQRQNTARPAPQTPRVTSVPALFLDRWLEVLNRESVGALWQSMMFLPGWLHLPETYIAGRDSGMVLHLWSISRVVDTE